MCAPLLTEALSLGLSVPKGLAQEASGSVCVQPLPFTAGRVALRRSRGRDLRAVSGQGPCGLPMSDSLVHSTWLGLMHRLRKVPMNPKAWQGSGPAQLQ